MNFKQELKKMNLSDLRWICKKLYIEYKQKDSKSILIKNLLSPLNRKYKMKRSSDDDDLRQKKRRKNNFIFDIKDMEDQYDEIFSAIVQSIISYLPSTDVNGDMVAIKNLFQFTGRSEYQFLQTVRQRRNKEDPDSNLFFMTYDNFVKRINACQQLMQPGKTPDPLEEDLKHLRPGLYNVGDNADYVHYYAVIDLTNSLLNKDQFNIMFGLYSNGEFSNNIFDDIFDEGGYIVVNGYYNGWPSENETKLSTDKLNQQRFIGLDAQPTSGLCQCNAIISMLACNGGGH